MPDDRRSVPPDGHPGARHVFSIAWPMTLKAIFLHGTIVIDGWLVSSLGETSLGAMGLAAATGGILLGAIFAFSHAMQIRTAQSYGSGDPVFLKSVLASGLAVSLTIGIIGVAAIFLLGQALIGAIAPGDQIAELAWSYLMIFSVVILGESISLCIASFFNGCGRTRIPLYGYCLSVPINITSSIALIHGLWGLPAFGVAGAAMGSAIAITVQALFLAVQLIRSDGHLRKQRGWHKVTFPATLKRHIGFALPIATTFISATLAAHVCTMIFARLDIVSFAALTLIAPWNMIAGQISMQWSQASGIFVAQLLGRHADASVLDGFLKSAWRGAFVAAAIVALILLVMCLSVDVLYADLTDQTRAILVGFLPILLPMQFLRTSNAICGNTLRASGDTIYVMHIFIWSQWLFRVPATAFAVLYLDLSAFWILSIWFFEEVLKFPAFHRRLWQGNWKHADVAG